MSVYELNALAGFIAPVGGVSYNAGVYDFNDSLEDRGGFGPRLAVTGYCLIGMSA